MRVSIMGNSWSIEAKTIDQEPRFSDCDGFCDWTAKKVRVRKEAQGNLENMDFYVKKVMRHEIIHAFLFESGLGHSSGGVDSWATNEEMVDWIAMKGPEIVEVWRKVGAI